MHQYWRDLACDSLTVTCHCFFHPAKKLRSGAIVRFSDNSSFIGIYLRSQVSVYRTIGPLVLVFLCGGPIIVCLTFLQPIQLLNYTLEMAKPGKFPNGKTEIPFEVPLKPKANKTLYETYHGVFVNIQVCTRFCILIDNTCTMTKYYKKHQKCQITLNYVVIMFCQLLMETLTLFCRLKGINYILLD